LQQCNCVCIPVHNGNKFEVDEIKCEWNLGGNKVGVDFCNSTDLGADSYKDLITISTVSCEHLVHIDFEMCVRLQTLL